MHGPCCRGSSHIDRFWGFGCGHFYGSMSQPTLHLMSPASVLSTEFLLSCLIFMKAFWRSMTISPPLKGKLRLSKVRICPGLCSRQESEPRFPSGCLISGPVLSLSAYPAPLCYPLQGLAEESAAASPVLTLPFSRYPETYSDLICQQEANKSHFT